MSQPQPVKGFNQRLYALEPQAQQAFMAALCERLVPNYALYAQASGQGDLNVLKAILALVWERLQVKSARIDFDLQADKLVACHPPAEDDSFGARRAMEVVSALSALLDTLRGGSLEAVVEVSRTSRSGVQAFIAMTEGEEDSDALAANVREHPLMADENDFQDAVLAAAETPLSREALKSLRLLGRNDGVSNLGVSIDGEE
ncbi:YjaG family protein [Halomonas halocynthiae]|uniref:YjaG family protein n=1 Tax=Halomonas halocynthiae TaxID=176290 RepID=UPI0003FF3C4B|nr:YjaG family protein [Halomonas halocynthiae]